MNIPGLLVCQEGCLAFIYSGGFIRCESRLNGPDQSMTTAIQWSPVTRPFSPFSLLIDNPDTCSLGRPSAKSARCSWETSLTLSAHKGLSQVTISAELWSCSRWPGPALRGRGALHCIASGLRWLKCCQTSQLSAPHFLKMLSLCSLSLISIVLSSLDHCSHCS